MWTTDILTTISQLSVLLPLFAGLILFRRLDRPMGVLWGMFVLAAFTEAVSYYLAYTSTSNLWLGHLWTAVEIPITLFVFSFWQRDPRLRRLLRGVIPVYLLVLVLNKLFLESFDTMDSYSRPLGCVLLIAAAVLTFHRILVEPSRNLLRDPRVWVASAVLIYHAGTLTIFALARGFMAQNMRAFEAIYDIHSVINILTNLLFMGGFLCLARRWTSTGSASSSPR